MVKIGHTLAERRRYIRLRTPINISYNAPGSRVLNNAVTKDILADGLRFETHDKALKEAGTLELKLTIPGAPNPVHAKGAVIWKRKISLEDHAPYDVGLEIEEVEEDNKNTFLKFFCDFLYNLKEK